MGPTIVLVHDAFMTPASWAPVADALRDLGHRVHVPQLPHRSLSDDAAYVGWLVEQIDGPVVLAGLGYGGAVITVAGDAENVVGLVYVAALVLAAGESVRALQGSFPDSKLAANLIRSRRPDQHDEEAEVYTADVDAFRDVFAASLDPATVQALAASQRPFGVAAREEAAPVAAWRSTPSWGVVAAEDAAVAPDLQRFGYERAGVRSVVELDAPHLVTHTHPEEVAAVVVDAVAELAAMAAEAEAAAPRSFAELRVGDVLEAPVIAAGDLAGEVDAVWVRGGLRPSGPRAGLPDSIYAGTRFFADVVGECFVARGLGAARQTELRPGDTLSAQLRITGLSSTGATGAVMTTARIRTQRGEVVLEGAHTFLLRLPPTSARELSAER